jgi:hypothetical protein
VRENKEYQKQRKGVVGACQMTNINYSEARLLTKSFSEGFFLLHHIQMNSKSQMDMVHTLLVASALW